MISRRYKQWHVRWSKGRTPRIWRRLFFESAAKFSGSTSRTPNRRLAIASPRNGANYSMACRDESFTTELHRPSDGTCPGYCQAHYSRKWPRSKEHQEKLPAKLRWVLLDLRTFDQGRTVVTRLIYRDVHLRKRRTEDNKSITGMLDLEMGDQQSRNATSVENRPTKTFEMTPRSSSGVAVANA